MPARTLPTIPIPDIQAHNTEKSCYVTIGAKVYDVTSFLEDHPGGGDLILEHGGQDIEAIMKDEVSHFHSESAYEILDECLIGFVADEEVINGATKSGKPAEILPLLPSKEGMHELEQQTDGANGKVVYAATGMSSEEDLSKDTDFTADYRTHKFLDLSKPLFLQVWNGGFSKDFYLEQVHRPRHYKGGDSAPLFGNFLEPLTKTPWWVVPSLWLPPVIYGTVIGGLNLGVPAAVAYWLLGLLIWTFVEYILHRFLFHLDEYLPDNRVGITMHFLLHGIHHYLPMDKYRLVMPPTLFIVLATPFWKLAHIVFFYNWHAASTVFSGGIFGYICYDMTHYFLHHKNLPAWWRQLKKYHLKHHFADYANGFGVSSPLWDYIFHTELEMNQPKIVKSA
ncbi:Inositolphosphorylceramide-B hydroxylase [Delitschia confertaspora ATCC 74209]|uniref:Ceramide very long chain fatty acid hydroxylase n=1 Tax=Delitschia confertaspora ATCC 74209 TaxID=1513339 RepID=A0A9P4MND7_9PLEO|nr:Inositolphosphorylceramide-B hydroxylase [Delitschia confertaspora ATCC 74209]